jgi:hypothetical protein
MFFIGHGLQCSAAEPQHSVAAALDHGLTVVATDVMAAHDNAPGEPQHGAGHVLAVCFAVLVAALALLFDGRRRRSTAVLARRRQRRLADIHSAVERWRTNVAPLSVLCVSRT